MFMATYRGRLEPGYIDGHARTVMHEGVEFYDWPQPWAFRCDFCGRIFPYGCTVYRERTPLWPPNVRSVRGDDVLPGQEGERHRCAYCEGWRDRGQQLELFAP